MIEHCLVDLQKSVFIDVFQISDENTDLSLTQLFDMKAFLIMSFKIISKVNETR